MMMDGPDVVSLNETLYFREDVVAHHVAGYKWKAVPVNVHKKTPNTVQECETCTPHEVFYILLADDGAAIRKWSRTPFDGARMCRVEIA